MHANRFIGFYAHDNPIAITLFCYIKLKLPRYTFSRKFFVSILDGLDRFPLSVYDNTITKESDNGGLAWIYLFIICYGAFFYTH